MRPGPAAGTAPAALVPPPVTIRDGLPLETARAPGVTGPGLAVFAREEDVRSLTPDFSRLKTLDRPGMIVTAPGHETDFVSRFFIPAFGIPEDPVTGSAHCTLMPYWSKRLGRTTLTARQISARGGELVCEQRGDRVVIKGHAAFYLEGTIQL